MTPTTELRALAENTLAAFPNPKKAIDHDVFVNAHTLLALLSAAEELERVLEELREARGHQLKTTRAWADAEKKLARCKARILARRASKESR